MPQTEIIEDWVGRYYSDRRDCGEPVRRFTLSNSSKCSVQIVTYGASVTSLKVPGLNDVADVVLGFDTIEEYYKQPFYVGSTIGRVSNRIAHGRFILNNKGYLLAINNPPNHLHGGIRGYDKVLWESHVQGNLLTLTYISKDGEEGYPGECVNQATFQLTCENELVISYVVTTSKPCPVSLTNHSYFNLAGFSADSVNSIYDHIVTINADKYTPVDRVNNIPTGELAKVDGTLLDFRRPIRLGDRLQSNMEAGYDDNFCIKGSGQRFAARVSHPGSGRVMELSSTMPGLQLYTANFLPTDASLLGRGGAVYSKHSALCLEPQHYPNAVNQHNFPNCILNPGETYEHQIVYKFFINSDN